MVDRLASFYTDFTGIESEFTSPTMGTALNYLKANIEVAEDTEVYKTQGLCRVCKTYVKDGFLSGKNRKKFCKFCFQAVCSACSPFKILGNGGGKKKRLCIACVNDTVKRYFRVTIGPVQPRSKSWKMVIQEKQDEEHIGVVVEEINRRKKDIENVKKEIAVFTGEKKEEGEVVVNDSYSTTLQNLADDYKRIGTELIVANKRVEKNRELIKKLKNDQKKYLLGGSFRVDRKRFSQIDLWNCAEAKMIIWDQIVMQRGLKKSIEKENEALTKVAEKKTKLKCIIF
jgi:hypothetical protein